MSRINLGVMEELRRQAQDTLIDIRENIRDNRHWMVFPFNVYSSYIPDTETGWKPNNAKPSDYGSYSRIFYFDRVYPPYGNKQKTVYPVINYASSIPRQLYIKKITFWSSNPLVFLVSDIVFFSLTTLFL